MEPVDSAAQDYDAEVREPRCRICRHEDVRVFVNELLDWRGVPVSTGKRRLHRITYTDILHDLNSVNSALPDRDRITYSCLWVHAKRHQEADGVVTYWNRRFKKELRNLARAPGSSTWH